MSTRPDMQLHKLIRIKKLNKTCKGIDTTPKNLFISHTTHQSQIKNSKNFIYYWHILNIHHLNKKQYGNQCKKQN